MANKFFTKSITLICIFICCFSMKSKKLLAKGTCAMNTCKPKRATQTMTDEEIHKDFHSYDGFFIKI